MMRNRLDAEQLVSQVLDRLVPDARVVGLGEGAHFVREFNHLRAQVVAVLVDRYAVTQLALEVGDDEAPAVEAWLHDPDRDLETLRDAVGPLTFALYGTFLLDLSARAGARCGGLRGREWISRTR